MEVEKITKNHFNFNYVIGKGGFGKVWVVEFKKTKVFYALKEMLKAKYIIQILYFFIKRNCFILFF